MRVMAIGAVQLAFAHGVGERTMHLSMLCAMTADATGGLSGGVKRRVFYSMHPVAVDTGQVLEVMRTPRPVQHCCSTVAAHANLVALFGAGRTRSTKGNLDCRTPRPSRQTGVVQAGPMTGRAALFGKTGALVSHHGMRRCKQGQHRFRRIGVVAAYAIGDVVRHLDWLGSHHSPVQCRAQQYECPHAPVQELRPVDMAIVLIFRYRYGFMLVFNQPTCLSDRVPSWPRRRVNGHGHSPWCACPRWLPVRTRAPSQSAGSDVPERSR